MPSGLHVSMFSTSWLKRSQFYAWSEQLMFSHLVINKDSWYSALTQTKQREFSNNKQNIVFIGFEL